MAGLFFGIVIVRSEGLINHSLLWLRKKAEEILLSVRERAHWKLRPANGVELWTAEADTHMASWHPFHLFHDLLAV